MYRIVIGDDDELFLKEITAQVEKIMTGDALTQGKEFEVVSFAEPDALYRKLSADPGYCQLLLLDVEFAEQNGMELAKKLREQHLDCGLIYITSHRDYVYDCFGARPLWYLVKPVDFGKLAEIIRSDHRERYEKDYLKLKTGGTTHSIPLRDIYALEAVSHRVRIWFGDGDTLDWSGPLAKLQEELPDRYFCRCHNSYIINLLHVSELMRTEVKMENGIKFPVSRRYYASAMKSFFAVLKK